MEQSQPGRKMEASMVPQEAVSRLKKVMRVQRQMVKINVRKMDMVMQDCGRRRKVSMKEEGDVARANAQS